MDKTGFKNMKEKNRMLVLNSIRNKNDHSRASIAKQTKLTPPTVSTIVKNLIKEGLVYEEDELGDSSGGRKPKILSINWERYNVIGIDVSFKVIKGILSNMNGDILHHYEVKYTVENNDQFLETLLDVSTHLIEASEKTVYGIGVAMHGVVDRTVGKAVYAPNLKLTDIPIKLFLEQHFDVEVIVDNDVRCMLLNEVWFNKVEDKNIALINLGHGVGGAIMLDGKILQGINGFTGEVGHMILEPHGQLCKCGNSGCLETLISGEAIKSMGIKHGIINNDHTALDLYNLALDNNEIAINIFQQIGFYIGQAIVNIFHIVNPERVILTGGVSNAYHFFEDNMKAVMSKSIMLNMSPLKINTTDNKDGAARGACALVIETLFKE
ncbi:ROK family transcriptional regulator [Macrococcoides canis]|uniref:ROK family protein n=1 Tax=Macrococcoides canis TaxID=1855823 RepID=A0AAE6WYM2_9STAP|nr:ROK family transcriptional regulator [Macrococcus canis]QIH77149.1 ROK family protein [Macrococcus canis]